MNLSIDGDVSSPLSDGQAILSNRKISKSPSLIVDVSKNKLENVVGQDVGKSEPSTPKPHPMAFTVDFGEIKGVDKSRLEELAKKSQARHQRVQSMSASLTRQSPIGQNTIAQKPPLSAKLPRKAQGYNSEGYFSSDQEDCSFSNSMKLRQSPLAQSERSSIPSSVNRHLRSPVNDIIARKSKSPIVDSIMSRSDILPSKQDLILPIVNPNSSYMRDVRRSSYNNLSSSYQPKMGDIIDHSPDGVMLTDISSPELDILTPDHGLSTPEQGHMSPLLRSERRAVSETPDLVFIKSTKVDKMYINDDIDRESNCSSTGTYTIEGDNYTEEQKARMSIDRTLGTESLNTAIEERLKSRISCDKDPELIFDYPSVKLSKNIKTEVLKSPVINTSFDFPSKVSSDKNVLEISCSYESPPEKDLAVQTSKQIKSTRSYLEKIKSRVRTITEKTFPKPSPRPVENADVGNFTSVTTSGVLSSKNPQRHEFSNRRRCSLTKSEIDKTDYIHRLSRESSVPVSLPSKKVPIDNTKFESSVLRNAQKTVDDSGVSSDITPEQVVEKLSYLSLNRCKGDKTWIQDWADSVKKYNRNTLGQETDYEYVDERPPQSPQWDSGKCSARNTHSSCATPTKIPSPVGTMHHRQAPDLIPKQDTEAYLQKTQNAITNLQAKLHSSRTHNLSSIPQQLTSSLISEKTAISRLPVAQLSRSNSLNYRLRRKETSNDGSPLRSPGNYVITGSAKIPESTRKLLANTSRSLETERKGRDSNMNSPSSDRGFSNSSDDKTLSNRHDEYTSRRTHSRNRSFDGRNASEYFTNDFSNANSSVSLKTVLKNNAEAQNVLRIDQTRYLGDQRKTGHQRVKSDGLDKPITTLYNANLGYGNSMRRSSSFNTVNKNNNYLDPNRIVASRRSNGHDFNDKEDYLSDESDRSFNKPQETRFKRPVVRGRIDSPNLKSIAPSNSPRCPNTPELQRKFGPGLVRNSVRVTNKEMCLNTRMSEPPVSREDRSKPKIHQSRKISEPSKQVFNRLTKSRSSTREFQPKVQEKGSKKLSQHRSSSALATKEQEFTNWKKRSSYDPMKAAQEGRKRQQQLSGKRKEIKDDMSSPSHSTPVHRSQSFHTTNITDLDTLCYSSDDDPMTIPLDPMVTSTHSDNLDFRHEWGRQTVHNDVLFARDYVAGFQINQPQEKIKRRSDLDKRKTFILDDGKDDYLKMDTVDKRKTFILDSDTNSTTNGSSPRNSSIFSHDKGSPTPVASDTDGDSGADSGRIRTQRHSGDYSTCTSSTSVSQKKPIQPRYLDISKYKNENSSKNFLRRDPSKTYVNILNNDKKEISKGSAQHYEMEQKKQELEKWKRRASYDPRKAAALGKTKTPVKSASSVLRSQSFHGPVLTNTHRYQPSSSLINETYDASSDNDF